MEAAPDTTEEAAQRRLHRLIVLLAAFLLAGLRMLPAYTSGADKIDVTFLGFPYSIEDTLQYADFVAQAKEHASPFLSNRFTLEPEEPRLVILSTWIIGRFAALTGMSVSAAWVLAQGLLTLGFVLVWYWFLGVFFPAPRARLFACLFVLFAGGLDGFVALAAGLWPEAWAAVFKRDLWVVLGWTPYMSMYNPVYLAGWLVLLPWLRLVMGALSGRRWLALAAAGLLPLMYLVHAYDAAVAVGLLLLVPLQPLLVRLDGRAALRLLVPVGLVLLGAIPIVALAVWQAGDPLFAQVAAAGHSGLFVSPAMWILGFGGLLLAAAYGMRRLAETGPRAQLLFGWFAACALLSFSPLFEGRHFLYFVSLPLGILAVDGLGWLRTRFDARGLSRKLRLAVLVVLVLVFGNSFVRTTARAFTHPHRDDRMYITWHERRIAQALTQLPPGGVLASRRTCNWLPHLTGHRCAMGHWFMTPDMAPKVAAFARLADPRTPPAERDAILMRFGARYLFWGPREARLGPRPRTDQVRLLPLQVRGGVFLLAIELPPLPGPPPQGGRESGFNQ